MTARPIVVVLAAGIVVLGGVWLSQGGGSAELPPPDTPSPERASGTDGARPPEFPEVRGDDDRIAHWVRTVVQGADDDVAWALGLLERAGPAGRAALRDAAKSSIESNTALTQQALEFLLKAPEESDGEFAVAALASRDPEASSRAMRLLARIEGGPPDSVAKAIGAAGNSATRELRLDAIACLAKRDDAESAAEAIRLTNGAASPDAPDALRALASFSVPAVRDYVATVFRSDAGDLVRLAAAEVLVGWDDRGPVAWLESLLASPPAGSFDFADAALGVLAKARHDGALARIGATAAHALAGTSARVAAVRRLEPYPLAAKLAFLEAAAAPAAGADPEVAVEALDALVRADAPGILDRLARMVREGDSASGGAAALVLGRVRRAEAAPALVFGIGRKDIDDELRTLYLRALVLSGAPDTAGFVARAIAADAVPYGAPLSIAYNAGAMLGDSRAEFRAALAPELVRALGGEFGPLSGAGLVQTVRAAGICCGPEVSAALAERLGHADAEVRTNAALSLGYTAGASAERDLRAAWFRWKDEASRAAMAKAMERAHYRPDDARRPPR